MLAEKNESIAEATETVYKLSEEEMIRLQCEAREDYYRRQRDVQLQLEWAREDYYRRKRDAEILMKRALKREQEALQQKQAAELQAQELTKQVQELTKQVAHLTAELEESRAKQTK